MSLSELKNNLQNYAKDIKLNLDTVLTESGAPDLKQKEIDAIALASAFASRNPRVTNALHAQAKERLSNEEVEAMKAAASIMAMNNVYYRFTHTVSDKTYTSMPAKLRMNVLATPGIEKSLFELASLAVSAINGCGMCMNAHAHALEKINVSKQAIQSAIRIASVVHAAAVSEELTA